MGYRRYAKRCGNTRLEKLIRYIAIAVVVCAVFILAGGKIAKAGDSGATASADPRCYDSIMIGKDDTLWGLAVLYAPEGVSTSDYVRELKRLNGLKDDSINQGMYLLVYDYR